MDYSEEITVEKLNSIDGEMRSGPERYAVDEKRGYLRQQRL